MEEALQEAESALTTATRATETLRSLAWRIKSGQQDSIKLSVVLGLLEQLHTLMQPVLLIREEVRANSSGESIHTIE